MKWRFVSLNAYTLASIFPSIPTPNDPSDYLKVYNEVFDFQPLRIRSVEELRLKNQKFAFANRVLTDDHAVNFVLARQRGGTDSITHVQLGFEDFTDTEIETYFEVAAIDPGRTQAFTAAYGCGQESHQIRRCSTSEYYAMTGSQRRNQKVQSEKRATDIASIENQWPTGKTSNLDRFPLYISHLLENFESLARFYNSTRGKMAFENYQGVQRAREEMTNVLINGGKKYNKTKRKKIRKNRKRRRGARGKKEKKKIADKWTKVNSHGSVPLENARTSNTRTHVQHWTKEQFTKTDNLATTPTKTKA
ncbi:hypothetical protein VKS41_006476 [Umbelopsis sp. WA50703]